MAPTAQEIAKQLKVWGPTLDALDPWRTLRTDEIDDLYVERPDAPLAEMMSDLLRGGESARCVLSGARGSGKTTELIRLARQLGSDRCVVYANLGEALPEDAGTLSVLALLGAALLRALETWTSPDGEDTPATATATARRQALGSALQRFGLGVDALASLIEAVAPLVWLAWPGATTASAMPYAIASAKTAQVLRRAISRVQELLRRDGLGGRLPHGKEDDARAVVEAVNGILAALAKAAGRPPLLIAEGLDKLATAESVKLALADAHLLLDLETALVLSGPTRIQADIRLHELRARGGFRYHALPNVPVRIHGAEGATDNADGVNLLVELYRKRMAQLGDQARRFPDELVAEAAKLSSGITRDFLALLEAVGQQALQDGRDVAQPGDLDAAARAARIIRQGYLREHHYALLWRILEKGSLPSMPDADMLLYENYVVCYRNGDLWYEPHALLLADVVRRHDDTA